MQQVLCTTEGMLRGLQRHFSYLAGTALDILGLWVTGAVTIRLAGLAIRLFVERCWLALRMPLLHLWLLPSIEKARQLW